MSQGSLEGFVGRFGAGKTLLMTWRANRVHKFYDEIWTNYGLNDEHFPDTNIVRMTSGEDFFRLLKTSLANVDGRPGGTKRLVLLDEIHSIFDARSWNKVPPEVLAPLSQLRKAGLTVYYTSQHESQVEVRLRNYTNFFWLCRSWGRSFNFRQDAPLAFVASQYDALEFRKPRAEKLGGCVFRLSKKRTCLYDTFEVVERMSLEDLGSAPVAEGGSV